MPKQQINVKLPPPLINTLRAKATAEGITLTDLIQGFCEQGLGLPPSSTVAPDLDVVYERIVNQLYARIAACIAPLQERIDDRIRDAMQKELDPVLGELSA